MASKLDIEVEIPWLRVERAPLKEMLADGTILRFGRQYRARGLDSVSLADVLGFAKGAVDETSVRKPGRRNLTTESRQVLTLTKSQFEKGRAALNKVGQYLHPDLPKGEANARVGSEHLLWNPTAGVGGRGDWAILDIVRSAGGTAQHVGDARTVMDLAATHQLITSTRRHDPEYCPVPTAWADIHRRWSALVRGHPRCEWAVYELLAAVSTTHGTHRSPDRLTPSEWGSVIGHCEAQWETTGTLSPARRSEVRAAYRALHSAGVVQGPPWDGHQRQMEEAVCVFPGAFVEDLAFTYCWDRPDESRLPGYDAEVWRAAPPEIASLMREGPFSLHRVVLHFTETDPKLLEDEGIPPRDMWPREAHRMHSGKSGTAYKTATLVANLRLLGLYLGVLKEHEGLDFGPESSTTLDEALSVELLDAFYRHGTRYTTKETIRRTMIVLARIASPFGEGTALLENLGDEVADRMAQVSKLANSPSGVKVDGQRRTSYAKAARSDLKTQRQRNVTYDLREISERTNEAWCLVTGQQHGFLGFIQVMEFQRRCALTALGADDFREVVESGDVDLSREQAVRVRAAAMLQDDMVVPLRTGTMLKMTREAHRRDLGGTIVGHYPAWMMKASDSAVGDLRVLYWDPGVLTSRYDPYLFDLYVAHARHVLAPGNRTRFWVPDVAGREEPHRHWGGISGAVPRSVLRTAVEEWASRHEIDASPLFVAYGNGTPVTWHRLRHLFARFWCARRQTEMAARLLHHSSLDQVMEVYGRRSASSFNPGHLLVSMTD